jgi:hypothetical protein
MNTASKDAADVRVELGGHAGGSGAPARQHPADLDELEYNIESDRRRTSTW